VSPANGTRESAPKSLETAVLESAWATQVLLGVRRAHRCLSGRRCAVAAFVAVVFLGFSGVRC
jgi:hypothetical protein